MKTPLAWLSRSCTPGSRIPSKLSDDWYQASWDFTRLADQYDVFQTAYIYASAGEVSLKLDDDTIVPEGPFRDDARFEAYDRLLIATRPNVAARAAQEFFGDVAQSVTVSADRFRYRLNPAIVKRGLNVMSPMLDQQFWLPSAWQLPRYSFGDFREIISVLRVIALIHHFARVFAARQGCLGMGYVDSVLIMDEVELLNRLRRYTGLDERVVREIVADLTYGARLIRNPDPALQPLIRLTAERYAISPTLFIGINAERNFTVLLNRFPEEKQEYRRLSTQREELSRRKITEQLKSLSVRFWHGEISGRKELPDIDLAIIDDTSRTCLVLELKAFVAPAEPREVLEKSKEIQRGVSQIKTLCDAFSADRVTLERPLAIDDGYAVFFAVASETFIGASTVQDEAVAVVRVSHLVQRLCRGAALSAVCHWLYNRDYLPIEGQHYEVKDVLATVGDWKIQWYGIHPLIDAEYS